MSADHSSPLAIELGMELAQLARASASLIERAGKQEAIIIEIRELATEGLGAPTRSPDDALRSILRKANEALKAK